MKNLVDLKTETPIDLKKAVEILGGQKSIFFKMIAKIESSTLVPTLKDLAIAYDKKDYPQIKNKAHALKGATGYVGASRVHYCCWRIQELFTAENYEEMMEYYPSLIEYCLEFKVYAR